MEFMEKVYAFKAEYICVIRNWRRACDERGLSEDERSHYNKDLLEYILDDLMPWHRQPGMHDYSLMEVNGYLSNQDVASTASELPSQELGLHRSNSSCE